MVVTIITGISQWFYWQDALWKREYYKRQREGCSTISRQGGGVAIQQSKRATIWYITKTRSSCRQLQIFYNINQNNQQIKC